MKPYLAQRIRHRLQTDAAGFLYAAGAWLAWALVAIVLYDAYAESGLLAALLLLGALALGSIAHAARRLEYEARRDWRWESSHSRIVDWRLNPLFKPRRPLPVWEGFMADPDTLEAARSLILERQPKRILELGSGLSTLLMAYTLEENGSGNILALEDHPGYAAKTRRLLAEHGLEAYARVIDAPLVRQRLEGRKLISYDFSSLDDARFDLLLVDGPAGYLAPDARYPALPLLYDRLSAGARILLDDTHRPVERGNVERWLAELPGLERDSDYQAANFSVLKKAGGDDSPLVSQA